jgi:hypothetical protein
MISIRSLTLTLGIAKVGRAKFVRRRRTASFAKPGFPKRKPSRRFGPEPNVACGINGHPAGGRRRGAPSDRNGKAKEFFVLFPCDP